MTPNESARAFQIPEGFRIDLVASEPMIKAPSGVCWDEFGRLYVSELHGYNLEGQYDIEALNKTGKLDKVVRRIQADAEAKKKAEAGTYGVIKLLHDDNGDGLMDRVTTFVEDIPPCYGMVAFSEGIIAVCAPHIYHFKDTDGDGVADVREILYTGFQESILERRINAPQWGLDNWIYVGAGGNADLITGPRLKEPVRLGRTDFRIRPDGSAIEAVGGHTGTFGHTFTAEGDRLTISTGTPGYQVIPLPWHYLKRNPELSIPSLERNAASYQTTYPVAEPHPWRTRRWEDPGFSKYYTDHYGKSESYPSGYFTSACSPMVYRDYAFPEDFHGANFTCEPAQNLIHHSLMRWDGPELHLLRAGIKPKAAEVYQWAGSERSRDEVRIPNASAWKQVGPIKGKDKTSLFETDFGPEKNLDLQKTIQGMPWETRPHYKDGALIDLGLPENAAVYLFRIIHAEEDVSVYASLGSNDAIKCWLNGKLLLENNVNRGLAAGQESTLLNLKHGDNSFLMKIVNGTNASGFYFKMLSSLVPENVRSVIKEPESNWSPTQFKLVENYVQTLRAGSSRKEFLASSDSWFHPINLAHGPDGSMVITDYYREIIEDYSAIPRYLQQEYGLTNGMHHGRIWRLSHTKAPTPPSPIMANLTDSELADALGSQYTWRRETARRLLIERKATNLQKKIIKHLQPESRPDAAINALYTLDGLQVLSGKSARLALSHPHWSVRRHALILADANPEGSDVQSSCAEWIKDTGNYGNEPRLLLQIALSLGEFSMPEAVAGLGFLGARHAGVRWMDTAIVCSSAHREHQVLEDLLVRIPDGSPLAELLVATIASRADRNQVLPAIDAIRSSASPDIGNLYASILQTSLHQKGQAERIIIPAPQLPDEESLEQIQSVFPNYTAALNTAADREMGRKLFASHCATCHKAGGLGVDAGPNLNSEFQRAPETILRDILFPNEAVTEGYETVRLEMKHGSDAIGLLESESPTSLTLRYPGGISQSFLRKNIAGIHTHQVSMMPPNFASFLTPKQTAAIIAFLRNNQPD